MARKRTTVQPVEDKSKQLRDAIDKAGALKAQIDPQQAELEGLKTLIVKLLKDNGVTKETGMAYKVSLISQTRVAHDDDGIIAVLKKLKVTGPVHTKEVLNFTELQDALYEGKVPQEAIKPFLSETVTEYPRFWTLK